MRTDGRTKAATRRRAGSAAEDSGAFVRSLIVGVGYAEEERTFRSSLRACRNGTSCELRYERLPLRLGLRRLPRSAEEREQEAVESDVPGGLPGEDEHDREDEQDGVAAGAPSEHEVHVHERTCDGGDADERSEDEADSDGGLAERDDLAHEELSVVIDEKLDEAAVPVVEDHRLGG